MKYHLLLAILLGGAVALSSCSTMNTSHTTTDHFKRQGVTIPFPNGEFEEKEPLYVASDKALHQFAGYVKFCKQPELPPEVQQVMSEDGWLCELTILQKIFAEDIKEEIAELYPTATYEGEPGIGKETINGREVFVWREQYGKTRLDHFLLLGDVEDYHFVSSPYGDGDTIRTIIQGMSFSK